MFFRIRLNPFLQHTTLPNLAPILPIQPSPTLTLRPRYFLKVPWTGHAFPHLLPLNIEASQVAQWSRNPPANKGYSGLIPGLERSSGEGNSNSLQYSCLGNLIEEPGTLQSVHGVPKELVTAQQLNNCLEFSPHLPFYLPFRLCSCVTFLEKLSLTSYPRLGKTPLVYNLPLYFCLPFCKQLLYH